MMNPIKKNKKAGFLSRFFYTNLPLVGLGILFILSLLLRLPAEMLTNSDSLYLFSLSRDIFLKGCSLTHHSLTPSPYLVPDFILVSLFYPFLHPDIAIPIVSLIHIVFMTGFLLSFLYLYSNKDKKKLFFFVNIVLFYGFLLSLGTYNIHLAFLPSMHGFSLYFPLIVAGYVLVYPISRKFFYSTALIMGIFVSQDRLFIVSLCIPLVFTYIFSNSPIEKFLNWIKQLIHKEKSFEEGRISGNKVSSFGWNSGNNYILWTLLIIIISLVISSILRSVITLEKPGRLDFPYSFLLYFKHLADSIEQGDYFPLYGLFSFHLAVIYKIYDFLRIYLSRKESVYHINHKLDLFLFFYAIFLFYSAILGGFFIDEYSYRYFYTSIWLYPSIILAVRFQNFKKYLNPFVLLLWFLFILYSLLVYSSIFPLSENLRKERKSLISCLNKFPEDSVLYLVTDFWNAKPAEVFFDPAYPVFVAKYETMEISKTVTNIKRNIPLSNHKKILVWEDGFGESKILSVWGNPVSFEDCDGKKLYTYSKAPDFFSR